MADNNNVNVQGYFTGALSANGTTFIGRGNRLDSSLNIPVLITGENTSASKEYSIVGGKFAKATQSHSFVFNGSEYADGDQTKTQYSINNPYGINRNKTGTFSVNANGGLDGVYVGETSLLGHMRALSGFTADFLSSDSYENNILHKSGEEASSGTKIFTSSICFSSSDVNNTVINGSSININSSNTGGILFKYGNAQSVTSTIKETASGVIEISAKSSLKGDTFFSSSLNAFNGIKLNNGGVANFMSGSVSAQTMEWGQYDDGDETVATTRYVRTAIRENEATGISDKNNIFKGTTTFANSVSLSTGVNADFSDGGLQVADRTSGDRSDFAANTKFVSDALSALCDGKSNVGSNIVPVYLSSGKFTQTTASVGTSSKPVYLNGGSITAFSATIGNSTTPLYMSSGVLTQCNGLVDENGVQTIRGAKTFSSIANANINGSLNLNDTRYSKGGNGYTSDYAKGIYINAASDGDFSKNWYNVRVGGIEQKVLKSGDNTLKMVSYRNDVSVDSGASITLFTNKAGTTTYATAPFPKTNGSAFSSTSLTSEVVPTVGWTNATYARKDGANFVGDVEFGGSLKIYGNYPSVDFYKSNNQSARIYQDVNNTFKISPCASSLSNTSSDSASAICLGSQSIGSGNRPVYLNKGVITAFSSGIGNAYSPVYVNSSGELQTAEPVAHLQGDEEISGKKDFTDGLYLDGGETSLFGLDVYNTKVRRGLENQEQHTTCINFGDSSKYTQENTLLGRICSVFSSRGSSIEMKTYPNSGTSSSSAYIGAYCSGSGGETYAYCSPPGNTTSTEENRVATTGWVNNYFLRYADDGKYLEIPHGSSIYFKDPGGTYVNGTALYQGASGRFVIGTENNNIRDIVFGSEHSNIGSQIVPVYLKNGRFRECNFYKYLGGVTFCDTTIHYVIPSLFVNPVFLDSEEYNPRFWKVNFFIINTHPEKTTSIRFNITSRGSMDSYSSPAYYTCNPSSIAIYQYNWEDVKDNRYIFKINGFSSITYCGIHIYAKYGQMDSIYVD